MKRNNRFRHESLQNKDTIQSLLTALTQGLEQGKVVLEDENDTMVLEPQGLLKLKISATQDEDFSRITMRIAWQEAHELPQGKDLNIHS